MFHRYLHPYHIGLHERNDQRFKVTFFTIAAAYIYMFYNINATASL